MNNPFTLSFGKHPPQYIPRPLQTDEILQTFSDESPASQLYMITGVRGSGKTVLLSTIAEALRADNRWIVVELNPNLDLLRGLAAKLCSIPELHRLFTQAKLDFSALGLGVSPENAAPVVDPESAVDRMLQEISKKKKKLLITIDEAVNNPHVRIFAGTFQILLRRNRPVFLLMTGLYENLYHLQNEKTLTFLYRAPKIVLAPLNFVSMQNRFADIFHIPADMAAQMAALTKGYPFAFQVLGYLYWKYRDRKSLQDILPEYMQILAEYVYEKIWSELSETDRRIVTELSFHRSSRISEIRSAISMSSEQFSVYRERLKRKGIVDTSQYGRISLSLPMFAEYVQNRSVFQENTDEDYN